MTDLRKERSRGFQALLGAAFTAVLVGVGVVTWQLFQQDYTTTVPVGVDAPRAGLLMSVGADVKERGVQVGVVKGIELNPDNTVHLTLGIYPGMLHLIAANVGVSIVPPTVFGAKYVDLLPPDHAVGQIARGQTISAEHVTVEVNQAFSHLVDVLNAAKPAEVSAALNAFADSLAGNGEAGAELIDKTNRYLSQLNPALTTDLNTDLVNGATVADELTQNVLPGLIKIGADGGTLSTTLLHSKATLDSVLNDLTGFSNSTDTFLSNNRQGLKTTLTTLAPVTALLQEYSPVIACTVQGLAEQDNLLAKAIGGPGKNAITAYASLLPSDPGYKYPDNLPVIGVDNAPSCGGLPTLGLQPQASVYFNTGANPYLGDVPNSGGGGGPLSQQGLARTFFDALSGILQTAKGAD